MKLHWKVLLWMVAGVLVGLAYQRFLEAWPTSGLTFEADPAGGVRIASVVEGSPTEEAGLRSSDRLAEVRGPDGERFDARAGSAGALESWIAGFEHGQRLEFERVDGSSVGVMLSLDPACPRSAWLTPFRAVADIFMRLLRMLIVPLILTSIVTGVSGIAGGKEFGRLGTKTLLYYTTTSMLAIVVGLTAINLFRPGDGAALPLEVPDAFEPGEGRSFLDILQRMVPPNVFEALSDNGLMLQVIVFSLVLGFFIGRCSEPHRSRIGGFFESGFAVMMAVAEWVLKLIPYGVFALVVKVVGETGFQAFAPMLKYMGVVTCALLVHCTVVLPLLLRFVAGISPIAWFRAVSPAILTAFSTSSSSVTLPVTLESVEKRGGVSNKITSFTLPLGATVNMDGTALYECVGVIFLSQFYASAGDFDLSLGTQIYVVLTALLASIGAAGIPSAGLVMMTAILLNLGLPVEGALLLLAIDRPLDMMRTATNVWSDSCGAAIIATTEKETILRGDTPA